MEFIIRDFKVGDLEDAGLLAAMWNASDDGWPGGWTHGIPETAERVLEEKRKADRLAILVAEGEGQILGYCDLRQEHGRDDVAYIPLLNVRPSHHGQGLGKALLLEALKRTIDAGFRQLTLGTWAGNLKAVPLYKKTGFFWVPETSVWMQNFIPTALTLPIARDFFAGRDWYRTFQRELTVAPDESEWQGIKVFPYRFEQDDHLFAMWIDRQAEAPTAVETDDLYVACIVGKEEVVCGLPHALKWEIVNKRARAGGAPLRVTLLAEGEAGIGLSVLESLEVADRAVIERTLTINPNVKRKEPGTPAHQVKSTLVVEGVPLVLGSAVKPMQPVEIQFGGQMVVAGKPDEKVVVRLKSNLEFPVEGELLIEPHPALHFDRLKAPFTLEPKSWTSCTFWLRAEGSGALATQMRAVCTPARPDVAPAGLRLETKAKPVTFRTLPLDSVYAWQEEESESIFIETPTLTVRVGLRGGDVSVSERLSGRQLLQCRPPELGPPFTGWRQVSPLYQHRLQQRDGKVVLTLVIPSERTAGVTIEKTLTVGAGSTLRVDHRILNGSDAPQRLKLRCQAWPGIDGKVTVPLREGLLHAPREGWGDFPIYQGDLPNKPDALAETWFALEQEGLVTGIVWSECEECEQTTLQFDLPEIPPQSHYDVAPVLLVAGRGNWELVRQVWRWAHQPSRVREERKPVVAPVLNATLEPAPLLITGPETAATLAVRSLRDKPLAATLAVAAGQGQVEVRPAAATLADVKRGSPFTQDVVVVARDRTPRVETVRLAVEEPVTTHEFAVPVVILGDSSRPVSISTVTVKGDIPIPFQVENGCLSFQVAPGFLGAMTVLERHGVNHLNSAYPEARAFQWMNPWFGGAHAYLNWVGDLRFAKETFTGAPVERQGNRGISWQGVGVACDLKHKDLCWLRLETEYLTTGGSNVVALVQRLTNRTDAPQGITAGVSLWAAVGGSVARNVLHYAQSRPRYEQAASTDDQERVLRVRRRGEYSAGVPCGRWAVIEDAPSGSALAVVASHPNARLEATDDGPHGVSVQSEQWLSLEPGETKEAVSWVALAEDAARAREYVALSEVWELP